jgi:hypothetical protein
MRISALALVLTLALALPALAQGPSQDGYIEQGPSIVDRTADSGDQANAGGDRAGGGASLPFTGMDLVLLAALGIGLLGVGAGMRQLTRPDRQGTASS